MTRIVAHYSLSQDNLKLTDWFVLSPTLDLESVGHSQTATLRPRAKTSFKGEAILKYSHGPILVRVVTESVSAGEGKILLHFSQATSQQSIPGCRVLRSVVPDLSADDGCLTSDEKGSVRLVLGLGTHKLQCLFDNLKPLDLEIYIHLVV